MNRIIILLTAFLTILCIVFPITVSADSVAVETIGIGAGGAFFEPLIDPTNSNHYVVFSDMNDIYHSFDAGYNWNRTITPTAFKTGCFSEDGDFFIGGDGVYISSNNGTNMDLIYPHPDTVKTSVSILGVNNLNIKADGYDNGYTVCMAIWENRIYFITIDWTSQHNMKILSCNFDGTDLILHYSLANAVNISPLQVNFNMVVNETGLYYTDGTTIWKHNISSGSTESIYEAQGTIHDFKKVDNFYFILDDIEKQTLLLYTEDFESFSNLSDQLTLSNTFMRYGEAFEFEWHFKYISGNDMEHIFLVHYSEVDWGNYSGNDIGGILKFNGDAFCWVYDAIENTHAVFPEVGWGYHNYSEIYGVCIDPNDGDHCIVSDISTAYDMYYNEEQHTVRSLHSKITVSDGVSYNGTTGLDCQTTYSVKIDPLDSEHMIICTTDLGLQISYDGGESFRRMKLTYRSIENTCYDLYFDENTPGLVYGLWSSRHDAPNTLPALSDANATGGFGISYDGGITWNYSYGTGLPTNSIPVKMYVVEDDGELTIGVATYNNGFYISYDSGKTFESISSGMNDYNGMIWGEDIVIADGIAYCLTSYHTLTGDVTPSALYKVDLTSGETSQMDLGEIVIARSLTYNEKYGLYINVIPYYYYGWIDEIGGNYFVNYGGGVYKVENDAVSIILSLQNGTSSSAFDANGTMYVAGDKGTIYFKPIHETDFSIYTDGLHQRLKNISIANDNNTLYITTFGGGTYRMPMLAIDSIEMTPQYTVTFCNYDGTVLSTQTVAEGMSAVLPETPERVSDENYHYIFSRWSENTQAVDCDLTVYACYVYQNHSFALQNAMDATCTEDGYTGDMACVSCGYVTAAGEVLPSWGHVSGMVFANEDATHTEICSACGGDIETLPCQDANDDGYCDVCGYAFPTYYSVTFVDWDGTVLSVQAVMQGDTTILPETPTREPDENGSYTFAYWDTDVTDVQRDLVVTAVYTMVEHTAELRGAYAATCMAEGYTGDTYCSLCEMLLEEGVALPMTDHVESDTETNNDGTHTIFCMACGMELYTETCADNDNDGYCDACGYAIAVTRFTKVSQFTNGEQYLIMGSGYALCSTLSAENATLTYNAGTYYADNELADDMLWTYNNGYLYTKYNGRSYYLTVQRGWSWNASYTLSVTTSSWRISTWSYSGNALSTRISEGFWQSNRYLMISSSTPSLSTRSALIDLYRLDN